MGPFCTVAEINRTVISIENHTFSTPVYLAPLKGFLKRRFVRMRQLAWNNIAVGARENICQRCVRQNKEGCG